MRKLFTMVVGLGLLAASARLAAQPPDVKPGPEHAVFKDEAGTWDAVVKSMGGESKGVLVCKVALNGLWLLEDFQCDFGGMKFEGHGASSYDPAKKKYINVWIDSMSTSPMISEGNFAKDKKTLTMTGNMPTPDGKTMKITMVTVMKDANTKVFTMKGPGPDGKEGEMMQITYKRRAK